MQRQIIKLFPLLVLMILMASCSKFRKIQKSGDWKLKYEAALKYYEKEDYYRSGVLFEEILPIIRGTEEAEKANFLFAYTYYYQNQFILSAHQFKQFTKIYGRSEYVMEAMYMHAQSLYMQSPIYSLDQTSTYEAITALQNFLNKYPYSEYSEKADQQIDELQIKLEKKAYYNAKLYYKLRNYKSSLVAFDNFKLDYPDSKYIEEISYLAIESIYELAKVSIRSKQEERFKNTIEKYENFVDKFPNSKYLQSAEKYYEDSIKELRNFADQNS